MAGWIKVHRKTLDNPVVCKDAEHLAIWMYLLLNATHTNHDSMFKGKRITLESGQLITGRKSISNVLKIDENKVQRVLKSFEKEQQIEQQTSNKNRLITILNWISYQDTEQQVEQQVNNKRTTSEQQVNTNKNVKNVKNVKNDNNNIPLKKESKIFNAEDKEYLLAEYLSKQISKRLDKPLKEEKILQNWSADFEKMVRLDKYDIEEIKEVLIFSQKNDFWQSNILSAGKFRKQYLTLLGQMKRDNNKSPKEQQPKANNKFHNFGQKITSMSESELEKIAIKRNEDILKNARLKNESKI